MIGSRELGPTLQSGDGDEVCDEIRLIRLPSRTLLDLSSYSIACVFHLITMCPLSGKALIRNVLQV